MATYHVRIVNQAIAHYRPSVEILDAKNKREAVSLARRLMRENGHDARRDGRLVYTAKREDELHNSVGQWVGF